MLSSMAVFEVDLDLHHVLWLYGKRNIFGPPNAAGIEIEGDTYWPVRFFPTSWLTKTKEIIYLSMSHGFQITLNSSQALESL